MGDQPQTWELRVIGHLACEAETLKEEGKAGFVTTVPSSRDVLNVSGRSVDILGPTWSCDPGGVIKPLCPADPGVKPKG